MCSISELIGNNLTSNDKLDVPKIYEGLKNSGTVIGFYFSASWCEPCVAFTELLILFYERLQNRLNKGKPLNDVRHFEVISVSSDVDSNGFEESIKNTPWPAISFKNHKLRKKLSRKFSVKEIPCLVLVDGCNSELITAHGRDHISQDLNGDNFPWREPSLEECFRQKFLKNGELLDCSDVLTSSIKGIYFSAHWCPPCRMFTPQLIDVYNKVKESGKMKFEIIFASFDRSQESFQEYSQSMPWLVLPFQDSRIKLLTKQFQVEGIPTLVMLSEDNEVICHNARSSVFNDLEAKNFPWKPDLIEELNDTNINDLQDSPCLVLFTDGKASLIEQALELLTNPAEEYSKEQKLSCKYADELPQMKFFYEGNQSDEVADSIRSFAQIDGRDPLVAVIDMSQQKVFAGQENKIDKETICHLINQFKEFCLHG